jgi:hypothetical protein
VPPYIHAEKVIPTHTNVICREHLIQMKIEWNFRCRQSR